MVQYAELNLKTSTNAVPGTSAMYRLPTMMPGVFHITATGHQLPHFVARAAAPASSLPALATPPVSIALARPGDGAAGGLGGGVINVGPIGPGGPGGPIIPPPYTVLLDIFHGDELVASGAPPPIQECLSADDDTFRVRVNYPANSQPTDTIQFNLMPYTSTLPLLTRRIPLWFLQKGFNNNWNGRNYISIAFENDTLSVRFDPEIASYYHLTELDHPLGSIPGVVPPTVVMKDLQLRVDSSSGGYQELPGPLPYVQVTASFGGLNGQPIQFSIPGGQFSVSDFSFIAKFYVIATSGVVDGALSTVVGYRAQVTTDLLQKVTASGVTADALQWWVNNNFHDLVIAKIEAYLNAQSGVVGAALTPWLLGAAYTVWDVRYDPNNSQSLPSGPQYPWVPQGDIVVTYVGLASPGVSGIAGVELGPTVLAINIVPSDGIIGADYTLPLNAVGGSAPYTYSVVGSLPPGIALSGSALAGVPTTAGVYDITVKVADSGAASATAIFHIAINAPGVSILTPALLPGAVSGDAYAQVLAATGGVGAVKWSATGVPAGLTLSTTGILSGTPSGDGAAATIVARAVDANGAIARRAFSLRVLDALLFGEQLYTPRGAGTAMYRPPHPTPFPLPRPPVGPTVSKGNLANIQHIVVLMMENRSFDHMLGYLSREGGRSDIEGLKWENDSNRTQFNYYDGRFYYPNRLMDTHLFNPESIGPDHSFDSVLWQMTDNMGNFVSDYASKKIKSNDPSQLSQVMGYYTGEQLPTYDLLAREFAVCDHWFCSHPGPTWPNRFVTLTGDLNLDSYGEPEVNTPAYADFTPSEATTIFDLLASRKVGWQYFEQRASTMRAYTKYTFDLVNVLDYSDPLQGFAASVSAGLKEVTFIDPLFGDLPAGVNSPQDNDDAPPSDLKDGQAFVMEVCTTLFNPNSNPTGWQSTMLVIVYDEHGGFYDHVQPPSSEVPLAGQPSGKLGPRVPAFVVSPYTPAGLVLKDVYDHSSIAATILNCFCAPHPPFMSARVSAARDLRDAVPLAGPRGTLLQPLFGPPVAVSDRREAVAVRAEPRLFTAPSTPDAFGSLLGAFALMLGQGGG
jgi:phospholipase C